MRNVIQWECNSFFFQKLTKIAQRLGDLPPDPHSNKVCDTIEYTSLLNTSPKLVICIFLQSVFTLSFNKILVKRQQTTASDLPLYDIFAPQQLLFLKISDDVIACDLWFGPPPIKNLATPMGQLLPKFYFAPPKYFQFNVILNNISCDIWMCTLRST